MKIYNKPIAEIIETQKTEAFCDSVSTNIPVLEVPGYVQTDSIDDTFGEE